VRCVKNLHGITAVLYVLAEASAHIRCVQTPPLRLSTNLYPAALHFLVRTSTSVCLWGISRLSRDRVLCLTSGFTARTSNVTSHPFNDSLEGLMTPNESTNSSSRLHAPWRKSSPPLIGQINHLPYAALLETQKRTNDGFPPGLSSAVLSAMLHPARVSTALILIPHVQHIKQDADSRWLVLRG